MPAFGASWYSNGGGGKFTSVKSISKNPAFYGLNPSPFSGREGYKEFLETPLS